MVTALRYVRLVLLKCLMLATVRTYWSWLLMLRVWVLTFYCRVRRLNSVVVCVKLLSLSDVMVVISVVLVSLGSLVMSLRVSLGLLVVRRLVVCSVDCGLSVVRCMSIVLNLVKSVMGLVWCCLDRKRRLMRPTTWVVLLLEWVTGGVSSRVAFYVSRVRARLVAGFVVLDSVVVCCYSLLVMKLVILGLLGNDLVRLCSIPVLARLLFSISSMFI